MALKDVLAFFSVKVDDSRLKKADKGVTSAIGNVKNLIGAFAALQAVRFAANLVNEITEVGDHLDKTSRQLGITTDALQRWEHAAGLSGVSGKQLETSFRTLQRSAYEAERGTKTYTEAFDKLGVSVADGNGQLKNGDQLLFEVGTAMQGLTSESEKVAIAQQIMGRSGSKMNVIFDQGSDAVKAMLAELDMFGGGMSKDAVQASADLADAQLRWNMATTSMKGLLATQVFPAMSQFIQMGARLLGTLVKLSNDTNIVRAVLVTAGVAAVAFGKAMLGSITKATAAVLRFILPWALLILVIEDLITMFEGGDSALGALLDRMLGQGATKKFVTETKTVISALGNMITGTDSFEERFTRFASALASATDGIVGEFSILGRDIVDALSKAADELYMVGANMVESLVEGFLSAVGLGTEKLTAASGGMASAVGKAIKNKLESKSPSKLTVREGHNVVDGLIVGFKDRARALAMAAKDIAGTAVDGVNPQQVVNQMVAGSGPVTRSASISQRNDISINVNGGNDRRGNVDQAREIGNAVGGATSQGLQDAAAALIAIG